ncbi:MAG: hypothetical protein Kow0090_02380 [Myxococcota bacterium]
MKRIFVILALATIGGSTSSLAKGTELNINDSPPFALVGGEPDAFLIEGLQLKELKSASALIIPATPATISIPRTGGLTFRKGRYLIEPKETALSICICEGEIHIDSDTLTAGECAVVKNGAFERLSIDKAVLEERYDALASGISSLFKAEHLKAEDFESLLEETKGGGKDGEEEVSLEFAGKASCIEVGGGESGGAGLEGERGAHIEPKEKPAKLKISVELIRKK